MSRGIGNIIIRLREEKGYSQNQICEGICSQSQLARIESNESIPDPFVLDRLFERMGKSTERLEYVLSKENYKLYELQYQIQKEILYQNFREAEKLLEEYEKQKKAGQPLHRQFIAQERAQIAWMHCEQPEAILMYLNEAISETISSDCLAERKLLSVAELKLLLFRWEICQGTECERAQRELWGIFKYIEAREYDAEELVKVYPYVVILLIKTSEKQEIYDYELFLKMTEKALELLRSESKILFMPEILEIYIKLLEITGEQEEKCLEFKNMRDTVLEIEEEFGVHYECYPLFQHFNRAFELDYELIRQNRRARKFSQERLCEDICTQETLSRIERGTCIPSNTNLKRLLEKMQRTRERIGMNITAEKYEMLALEKMMAVSLEKNIHDKSRMLIKELGESLNISDVKNQQYIRAERVRGKLREGICSSEEGIKELYDILYMTIPRKSENVFSYNLTHRECNILNQIANQFCVDNQKERGIALWKELLKNYGEKGVHPVFQIRDWELITGNMAGTMEELNYIEEPIRICMECLRMALEIGKGNATGRFFVILACVLERKHDVACVTRFRQALNILKLTKMEHRYRCVKKYVEEKGIYVDGD